MLDLFSFFVFVFVGWVWDWKSLCKATIRASFCDANNTGPGRGMIFGDCDVLNFVG